MKLETKSTINGKVVTKIGATLKGGIAFYEMLDTKDNYNRTLFITNGTDVIGTITATMAEGAYGGYFADNVFFVEKI